VSGLPRSGTSMMMRMLGAGGLALLCDGARVADVDNPTGYFEFERIKALARETDTTYLRAARGKAVKVISFLLRFLPPDNDYRVVLVQRDLGEVLASQRKLLRRVASSDAGADDRALAEALRRDLARARAFCRERSNFRLCEVSYRDAIADPELVCRRVNQFLGGHLDEAAMRSAIDASLYRNRG
jgi:hypothetical protein